MKDPSALDTLRLNCGLAIRTDGEFRVIELSFSDQDLGDAAFEIVGRLVSPDEWEGPWLAEPEDDNGDDPTWMVRRRDLTREGCKVFAACYCTEAHAKLFADALNAGC